MTIPDLCLRLATRTDDIVPLLFPNAKRDGPEWKLGSISGEPGRSLGIEREGEKAGLWHDRATGDKGNLFTLIKSVRACDTKQAADWACDFLGISRNGFVKPPFSPLTKGFKRADETEWRNGVASWAYTDASGVVIGHVVRFQNPTDPTKKDFLPLRLNPGTDPTDSANWKWRGWKSPEKAPIYGLHLIAAALSTPSPRPILIVEGEKTCDAARKLFPDHLVLTWQGGAKRVQATDWSPIPHDAPMIVWPDHDQPGRTAATYLKSRFPNARVIAVPKEFPEGWDLADPAPDGFDVRGILDAKPTPPAKEPTPYRCLGHDDAGFHYLSTAFGRIITLLAPEHTELNLAMIAPDSHWQERGYWSDNSNGVDYRQVAKALFHEQTQTGFHDPDMIRGLGCWLEPIHGGGYLVVYHAGDRLYVNGVETLLHEHRSPFIYPARKPISVDLSHPATPADTALLVQLCELLPWHADSWPWLLPAACFIAPICGALDWRPHAWLVGGKGTGKSFTYTNIMSPLLGSAVIKAQSSTTEAGIRQILQADALPVIFDEIEAKDEKSIARIRAILDLARQSSSETGGSIFKGSAGGTARQFRIRSTFIFSSIGMGATEAADESRIARMEFTRPDSVNGPARFTALQALLTRTTHDPAYCARIRARAILMAPRIRESASVFLSAISRACGDSRKGQQYGTLAAGYWHLLNDAVATPADADAWASKIQWADLGAGDQTADGDESRAIDLLLQYRTTLQHQDGTRYDMSVAGLIDLFLANDTKSDAAYDALMMLGVHPMRFCNGIPGGAVDIANRHSALEKVFHGTPYSGRWKDQFMRLDGSSQQTYQPRGARTLRATRLPLTIVRPKSDPE